MNTYESRNALQWPDADYELRAATDGFNFEGYVAVYGKQSVPLAFPGINRGRPFREVIEPGAFTKTLAENPDVTLRYQHNMLALPLGRTRAGTLTLTEDDKGLRARAVLPDNEWGRPVRDAIARGDVGGMSFRFRTVRSAFAKAPGDSPDLRTLAEIALGPEVSITEIPAYPDTSATVRMVAEIANVEFDKLSAAIRAWLGDVERPITDEQYELLHLAINSRAAGVPAPEEHDEMPDGDEADATGPAPMCCAACDPSGGCCADGSCPATCDATKCTCCNADTPRSDPAATPATPRIIDARYARLAALRVRE